MTIPPCYFGFVATSICGIMILKWFPSVDVGVIIYAETAPGLENPT